MNPRQFLNLLYKAFPDFETWKKEQHSRCHDNMRITKPMTYTRQFSVRVRCKTDAVEDLPSEIEIQNILDSIMHHNWEVIEVKDTEKED